MSVYISLLRGINVGASTTIGMEALRGLYDSLGLTGAQTLLRSGNVVFSSTVDDRAELIARLEPAIEATFGFHAAVVLRTLDEWRAVIERYPLPESCLSEPSKLAVAFLSSVPSADTVAALKQAQTGPETIEAGTQELYLFYPEGMGRSKLSNTLIEKKLQTRSTVRNWNTVSALRDLAESFGAR